MTIHHTTLEEQRLQRQVNDLLEFVRETRDAAQDIHGWSSDYRQAEAVTEGIADIHDNAVAVLASCGEMSVPLGGKP